MDYIIRQLNKRLNYYEAAVSKHDTANYLRAKIEYGLVFMMSFLWNSNLQSLPVHEREHVVQKIFQPTIGSVVDICRALDKDRLVFGQRNLASALNSYPALRNDRLGHGLTFEDATNTYIDELSKISEAIFGNHNTLLSKNYDLIVVTELMQEVFVGVNFKSSGIDYVHWRCPQGCAGFLMDNTYALDEQGAYTKLSPFIAVTPGEEFYLFRDVQERLLGRIRYNQLLKTGKTFKDWKELDLDVENDGFRRRTSNGTVINVFSTNYKHYIDVGVKREIGDFLLKNKSSVCATVWGHGGVGKTAAVQSICEDLGRSTTRHFDYIVFLSAKDRFYNYYTGQIAVLSERIDSFQAMIRCINTVISSDTPDSADPILNSESRLLIIVDDYETFLSAEKGLIEDFIRKLDINRHKVLITTRANIVIGTEFQTNELDDNRTAEFLLEVLRTEFPGYNIERASRELAEPSSKNLIRSVTSGRPLFIFQFAFVWVQMGDLKAALRRDIKQEPEAIDFLYGRIYDYLSPAAKELFIAISQLVTQDDLTNLIEKLRYVVNLEHDPAKFDAAFRELIRLRIVEIFENDFFRVYSKEILQIMLNYFSKSAAPQKGSIASRIQQVTRSKGLDNEHALLENANAARYSRSEEEVVSLYRQILHRASSPTDIKLHAILNLTDFLFNSRGKKELAIRTFKDFEHSFVGEPTFARTYANYCWALDNRDEALRVLSEFFASSPHFRGDRSLRFELAGLYLTYSSIQTIQRKEDIKTKFRFGEIEYTEFNSKNAEAKRDFVTVYSFGSKLFKDVRNLELSQLKAAARQNVITGLYQFANVCIRINRYPTAREVCEYGLSHTTDYLHREFISKLSYVERLESEKSGTKVT